MEKILISFLFIICCSCIKQTVEESLAEKKAINNKIETKPELDSKINTLVKNEELKNDALGRTIFSSNDEIANIPTDLKKFIPKNYSAIKIAEGDLNLDGSLDKIMVLRRTSEMKTSNIGDGKPDKRPLLILLNKGNNEFKIANESINTIPCIDCNGNEDEFSDVKIKNGYFTIESSVASGSQHWNMFTTFKYNKIENNWFLYKTYVISYTMNNNEGKLKLDEDYGLFIQHESKKSVKNFGKIPFEKYDYYDEEKSEDYYLQNLRKF